MESLKNFSKEIWVAFHNAIILAILFTMIGVGIGVKVSKDFYITKIDEIVTTGAMLHKTKVYTVQLKM